MQYWMIYVIIFVCFPLVLFWGASLRIELDSMLDRIDTSVMRGIAAIGIMFAHYIIRSMDEDISFVGPISALQWAGGLGVCVFFFCSGYGLFLSVQNKSLKKDFLWKRFSKILPCYWILRLIFALSLGIYHGAGFFLYVLGFVDQAWFVTEILLVYILFYISGTIFRKHFLLAMTGLLSIMSIVFCCMGLEARWYNANLVFIIGMVLALRKEKIVRWINRHFWGNLLGCIVMFGIFVAIFVSIRGSLLSNAFKLSAGGLVSLLLIFFLIKIRITSPFMLFVGEYSLQMYLIHLFVWEYYSSLRVPQNVQYKFVLCVLASVILTWLYSVCEKKIKYIKNRKR